MILLFNCVSAFSVNLDPLGEIYAGDIFQKNLTIQTGGDMLVYLSHNSSEGINISYDSPIRVDGERNIVVNISTHPYLQSDNYSLIIYANSEIYLSSGRHSSSKKTVIEDEIINNTIIDLSTVSPGSDAPINISKDDPQEDPQEEKDEIGYRIYGIIAMCVVAFFALMFWLYVIYKKIKLKNKNK